ncbi:MAG: PaRep2b protein, partial [Pyrobaculum sp.]
GANVTEEGVKPNVAMYWPREALDRIIAAEREELEPLLGHPVKSWRELVDAIDWSWVLERVGELVDELKSWIGPEKMSDAGRERLVGRMLGELALLAHFAEARKGKDDSRWREERTKRLARAVEALGGGRITGDHAERLAELIISYAESHTERTKKRIEDLAGKVGVSREEVWGVVDLVLSDMYCLARDCARDEVVRKFVAPAIELVMLDKALRGEFSREEAVLRFGEMYATALAGDGAVGPYDVWLTVGGELGGGAALLRLAALHLLNPLLPDEMKFGIRTYVKEGRYYSIVSTGEDAVRLKRILAVSAPSAGGGYLSDKFNELVKEARVEVRVDNIRETESGYVAADLIISEGGAAVKYNVYLREEAIELQFHSTDRSRVELAAHLLKLAGVNAEVKKESGRDAWCVWVTTDKLTAGHKELRDAIAEIVRKAGVDEKKAERWLEKLERGRVLMEGWPKYYVGLSNSGALEVRFESTDPNSIEQVAQWLEKMGLKRGVHFTVEMPKDGKKGYVYIRRKGLAYAAWLSVHGEGEQRRLAEEFVKLILKRAEEAGDAVYKKAEEIIEKGKGWRSLTLKGFEKEFEVDGKKYEVKVIDGEAVEEDRNGKTLLRIRITAEVGRVEGEHIVRVVREYTITYSRRGADNAAEGYAYASIYAPGGREADAERLSALIKALTGKEPRIRRKSDGTIEIVCGGKHLEGFMRYKELANTIKKWLEETSRRRPTH